MWAHHGKRTWELLSLGAERDQDDYVVDKRHPRQLRSLNHHPGVAFHLWARRADGCQSWYVRGSGPWWWPNHDVAWLLLFTVWTVSGNIWEFYLKTMPKHKICLALIISFICGNRACSCFIKTEGYCAQLYLAHSHTRENSLPFAIFIAIFAIYSFPFPPPFDSAAAAFNKTRWQIDGSYRKICWWLSL